MKFGTFIGVSVYAWLVWVITKLATTYGSIYYPKAINGWYNFNNRVIESIPQYGQNLRALMRDNIADGTFAFWEVWLVLGLLFVLGRALANDERWAVLLALLLVCGAIYLAVFVI